jgi:hypothetical protein
MNDHMRFPPLHDWFLVSEVFILGATYARILARHKALETSRTLDYIFDSPLERLGYEFGVCNQCATYCYHVRKTLFKGLFGLLEPEDAADGYDRYAHLLLDLTG